MSSDKMFVRAVLAGNRAAYAELYDRYAPIVRAVCYDKVGNLAAAQDLTQDVFMRAYQNLHQLRHPDRFGKWLIGIAHRCCQEWSRTVARERTGKVKVNHIPPASPDPAADERIELLWKAIATLPEKERLALHAFYLQDNSADDARRIMGLSRSGFYRVLERARERLKQLLVQDGEDIQ